MKRAFICSPYRGDRDKHADYLAACVADSMAREEAPFAPHGFYPAYLDDDIEAEREAGMAYGLAWLAGADVLAVYSDLGPPSAGMVAEMKAAQKLGLMVEFRTAGAPWKET